VNSLREGFGWRLRPVFVCGPEEIAKLVELRQEALRRIAAERAEVTALPVGFAS
jgi:hypothetical protein